MEEELRKIKLLVHKSLFFKTLGQFFHFLVKIMFLSCLLAVMLSNLQIMC